MKKNIITGAESADWPNVIGNTVNASPAQAQAAGWRDVPEQPDIAAGYTRISAAFGEGDGVTGAWTVVDRLTSEIEAEAAAADLAANGTRYVLENQYLTMCDQLTGKAAHEKLGFAELQAIIEGLMASDPNTAVVLSLRLLTLNAALVREAGVQWWDGCRWHQEVVQ
jgi:hypothetical protein